MKAIFNYFYDDLSLNPNIFDNKLVVISGILVVEDNLVYLIVGSENSNIRINICNMNFANRMLDNIPCYVGGKYLYWDTAELHGLLAVSEINEAQLHHIEIVKIFRDNEVIEF